MRRRKYRAQKNPRPRYFYDSRRTGSALGWFLGGLIVVMLLASMWGLEFTLFSNTPVAQNQISIEKRPDAFDTSVEDNTIALIPRNFAVVALGDSITHGASGEDLFVSYPCYLAGMLEERVQEKSFTFIGTENDRYSEGCGHLDSLFHEGHPGYSSKDISTELGSWLSRYTRKPDLVLLHIGTNDAYGGITGETKNHLVRILEELRVVNPHIRILLSLLIPIGGKDVRLNQKILETNEVIRAVQAEQTSSTSPVILVDNHSGFDTAVHTNDGVHPNQSGCKIMAEKFYEAIADML